MDDASSGAWRRISSFWFLYTCDAKSLLDPLTWPAVVWGFRLLGLLTQVVEEGRLAPCGDVTSTAVSHS